MKSKRSFVISILLLAIQCHATTVIVIVTADSIIIGADGKAVNRISGKSRAIKKAFIIQNRFVVATLGNANFEMGWKDTPGRPYIRFFEAEWMAKIEKKCPKNVSITELTKILEEESRIAFKDVDFLIADGAFDSQKPQKSFYDLIISGYEAGIPTVNRVKYEIDWKNLHLNAPMVGTMHPHADQRVDFDFLPYGYGGREFLDGLFTKGESHDKIATMIPEELPKLVTFQNLTTNEAMNVSLAFIRFAEEKYSNSVGPPCTLWVVRQTSIRPTSYADCRLSATDGAKNKNEAHH